jgi:hypothetical protein
VRMQESMQLVTIAATLAASQYVQQSQDKLAVLAHAKPHTSDGHAQHRKELKVAHTKALHDSDTGVRSMAADTLADLVGGVVHIHHMAVVIVLLSAATAIDLANVQLPADK